MKRIKEYLALTLVSIFLGLILSIQFKTVNKTVGEGILPTQRAQQLAVELKKAQNERDAQNNLIDEMEEKIEQYEMAEADKNVYAENLYNDTMKYRMLAGYLDLEGPGITMEINDPPVDLEFGTYYSIIDELDLILQAISVLNAADAEAISINDQRYTSFTEIERAGNHIEINGKSTNTPIVIKAIGKPETLESALNLKGGIVELLRDFDYLVQVNKEQSIVIPKSKKIKEFIYSVPADEKIN
ncbi:DUF881 domain-containing protein [Tissierella sp.]|uniref:DUF881 domain-containing protein n=1 Tax=Tissierella sp. TaxID=41274 RepID=UPI00286329C6|nr:DUF881 domain-containing protein [Tissierella sp.]MDR7857192.1 DUF881 domain-containing protein [Tissierella sp.]